MSSETFLSPAWVAALNELRTSFPAPEQLPDVVVNLVVNQAPAAVAAGGTVNASLTTRSGVPVLMLEHHDAPDVIVTADYDVVRGLLVDGDPAMAMSAFLGQQLLIQGEMIKLMVLFGALAADPNAAEAAARIQALTA